MQFFQKLPKKLLIGGGVALLLLVGGLMFFFIPKTALPFPLPDAVPTPIPVPKDITNLLDTVGKKTLLPQEEIPTVATVSDPAKLQDQPFFAKAKKGDKALMYIEAKKAFLYRPSTNEIIQMARLEVVDGTASESASMTASGSAQDEEVVLKVSF